MFATMSIIPMLPTALPIQSVQLEVALMIKHVTQGVTNVKTNVPKPNHNIDVMALATATVFGNGLTLRHAILTVVLVEVAMVVKKIVVLNARLVETVRTSV